MSHQFLAIIIFAYWGLNSRPHLLGRHSTTWATPTTLFCLGVFWDRVLRTICQGWLQTEINLLCLLSG
jgi:hypothetical protein